MHATAQARTKRARSAARLPFTTRLGSVLACVAAAWTVAASPALAEPAAGPLPSWRDGPVKQAILAFVAAASDPKSAGFVPAAERIAVFDGDGTLWPEQPVPVQLVFAIERVKALAPERPAWATNEPYRSLLAGDIGPALAGGPATVHRMVAGMHSGTTTEEFDRRVNDWLATARHPRFARAYTELVYQPMLELLALLRANGFASYLAASGGVDFLRPWSERATGIPPEHVVGGAVVMRPEQRDGVPVLIREAKTDFSDDGAAKPLGIQRALGRRPVMAFGNSDRDVELLAWTAARPGPSFVALLHHTDGDREWAYDRDAPVGRLGSALDTARAKGWTVIDMKRDWARVFAFDS